MAGGDLSPATSRLGVAALRRERKPSAALLLVAACCRWPTDAAAVRAAAAANGMDWDRVVALARRHRVSGFLAAGLAAAGITCPAAVTARRRRSAMRNATLHAEAVRISQWLGDAGIAHVFLKGAVVGQRAFGGRPVKEMIDNDVLIRPADAPLALAALERLGYRMTEPKRPSDGHLHLLFAFGRECQLINRSDSVVLDLHWRLHVLPGLLPEPDLAGDVESVTVGGRPLPALAGEQMLMHLVLHGARHRWSRLKWLAEFNALLIAMPAADRAALRAYAARHGVAPVLDAAMAQCARLFDTPVPADVLRTRRARGLVALSEWIVFRDDELADQHHLPIRYQLAGTASALLFRMSPRYWLGAAWDMLVPPRDVLAAPLPRALGPLYLVVAPGVRTARGLRTLFARKKSRRAAMRVATEN